LAGDARVYLIPITVPIYTAGARHAGDIQHAIGTDWLRALQLLRDSLGGRYGPLCVAAPFKPLAESDQATTVLTAEDGITLVPLFDHAVGLAGYWRSAHRATLARMAPLVAQATVVHGTVEESLRPFCYASFMQGVKARKPTVFFQDQDVVSVIRDLSRGEGLKQRVLAAMYARAHEHQCRRAIAAAGVSFLKGEGTLKRYAGLSANAHPLDDTSYRAEEMVSPQALQARLTSLLATDSTPRPLRLVSCGRLVSIKGVDRSLAIVAQARRLGANVTLDIIGGGPDEASLQQQAGQWGLLTPDVALGAPAVRFVGALDYGSVLLDQLATYDALLFNPRMEETPRVIFDGYAAGLPLIADGIPYVQERARIDAAVVVLARDDDAAAANRLLALDQARAALVGLSTAARAAGQGNTAESWYGRRAALTHDMVARHQHALRGARTARP
jgi:glycosyltransferase involved in cell wall biosynthesis